jgi:hypothetical protein
MKLAQFYQQLILRVGRFGGFVWLSTPLQFHKNEILMKIIPYTLKQCFNIFHI